MNRTMTFPRTLTLPRVFWKRIFLWMVVWNIFPLVALYFVAGAVAADLLTRPQRVFTTSYTPALFDMPYEDVRFPSSDGQAEIAAWYIPSADNTRAVILVHGSNASRTEMFFGHSIDLAHALHEAGFSVLMIDLRGHGQSSEGRFTYGLRERYDVIGAVDWLSAQGYGPGKIGVFGLSLGSSAAIGAAAEDERIGALVSDSGFADTASLIEKTWIDKTGMPTFLLPSTHLMISLKYGFDINTSRPAAEIGRLAPRPVLLIHCANDREIPYEHARQLQAAAPGAALWTIPACSHGMSYNASGVEYEQHLVTFMDGGLR